MLTRRIKTSIFFRLVTVFVIVALSVTSIIPAVQAQNVPSAILTPSFEPVLIKGINLHFDDPLKFDFIVDKGDTNLDSDAFQKESQKLIKYFLGSLTIPEDQMWVNLSPYEKDRIIPESFGQTDMGRDLLAQDYLDRKSTRLNSSH